MKLPVSEKVKTTDAMFREWHSVKIPKLEKMIQDNKKKVYKTTDIFEKRRLKRHNIIIKKDIDLLHKAESEFYKSELEKLPSQSEKVMDWRYNVPITIHPSVNKRKIYILEMNNDTNEICGISKIQNRCFHRRHNIYSDRNYNRYTYEGARIQSSDYDSLQSYKILLEDILFKGSTHQKRGQGIQKIAKKNTDRFSSEGLIRILEELF